MALLRKRKRKLLPLSLVIGIIISTSPMMDGCSRSQESPPAAAPAAQPNATAASMAPSAAAPATQPPPAAATAPAAAVAPPGPAPGTATPEQLESLVSPIALYPDTLIAQMLAASTYPTQIVEADRWAKEHAGLKGDQLAAAVNQQPWDPSVRSLTQFPPVLKTMSENLSWTTALGEAYYNQPQDVMNAIQVMRKRAMKAGTLKSTSQQKVEVQTVSAPASSEGGSQPAQQQPAQQQVVVIQPAQPNTVYVPTYNPSTVYGAPVPAPTGYSGTEMLTAGIVSFGVGMLVGSLINSGSNHWSCNWGGGNVYYNRNVYISNSAYMRGRYPYPGYAGRPYPGYPRPYPGARPPYAGYPPGGRYPGYPGNYPRPAPYVGKTPNYANIKSPQFPKANTLPGKQNLANRPAGTRPGGARPANRPAESNLANRPRTGNVTGRPGTGNVAGRPGGGKLTENRPQTRRPTTRPMDNPVRGFGNQGRGATGGRNGAFGGYQPGGFAQTASSRGRASMGGGNRFGGGERRGGGGGRRGGGGGGGRRR